jgi:hypothetical protein
MDTHTQQACALFSLYHLGCRLPQLVECWVAAWMSVDVLLLYAAAEVSRVHLECRM